VMALEARLGEHSSFLLSVGQARVKPSLGAALGLAIYPQLAPLGAGRLPFAAPPASGPYSYRRFCRCSS
jgi:hypothetical protein